MDFSIWWLGFLKDVQATGWIEWVAITAAVVEVLLARANNVLLYPFGILSTSLTIFIFIEAGLYAESLLNLYYVFMSIYGWWFWVAKTEKTVLKIRPTVASEWWVCMLIVLPGTAGLYFALSRFTNSTVPLWDAIVSATAWAGTWLLARRKIENWLVLNVSNALAIPLLLHKHLPMYAALTLFLFVIAVLGYFSWRKIYKEELALR